MGRSIIGPSQGMHVVVALICCKTCCNMEIKKPVDYQLKLIKIKMDNMNI